ncbi:MAG: adenylate/guanylate cyclase domain-containing protein, partial [Thermomicrobiales bacterium]|nr:adenylate/guanylate cyclase domain-containing protein [Thermomicrobiales bacterium]
MAEWPTGTVTFLFTDLEGSTQRWQQYPTAMGPALARHDRLVRDAISAHGGVVFKTVGDAVCAAFATAPAAVAGALTAQRALYSEPWGSTGPLRARMALHTGQAEVSEGDYLGGPLNRVARLLTLGHGGQILLSGPTADLVQDFLPPGVSLRDLGTHRLKDIQRPEHVFQLVAPDLPWEFAPLATSESRRGADSPSVQLVEPATERPAGWRRPLPLTLAAIAVVAVALIAALLTQFGSGDAGEGSDPTPTAIAAASEATAAPTNTATATVAATATATPPPRAVAAASPGSAVIVADGSGWIVYTLLAGQPGSGRAYRIAASEGATPEDLSTGLDALSPDGRDVWVDISPDGTSLLLGTERFDPECAGWPCLAVATADLAAAALVHVDGAPVHPVGPGAIAGESVVVPLIDGPHETDLWAIRRNGEGWDAPVLLTGDSPYAYHAEPAFADDAARIAFECGDRPYGEAGTALCEVGADGTG